MWREGEERRTPAFGRHQFCLCLMQISKTPLQTNVGLVTRIPLSGARKAQYQTCAPPAPPPPLHSSLVSLSLLESSTQHLSVAFCAAFKNWLSFPGSLESIWGFWNTSQTVSQGHGPSLSTFTLFLALFPEILPFCLFEYHLEKWYGLAGNGIALPVSPHLPCPLSLRHSRWRWKPVAHMGGCKMQPDHWHAFLRTYHYMLAL